MKKRMLVSIFLVNATMFCGCANRVTVPSEVNHVDTSRPAVKIPAGFEQGASESDYQMGDEAVSLACVAAWRKCVAGDKDGALKDLKDLEKKYPKITTVQFMIGQVLEYSGRKKEAIKYYKGALGSSEVNSMYLFKLAEAMRTTGNAKGAVVEYKRLLELSPDFVCAKLGLVKALKQLDPKSEEANRQIQDILKLEPENKEALALLKGQSSK